MWTPPSSPILARVHMFPYCMTRVVLGWADSALKGLCVVGTRMGKPVGTAQGAIGYDLLPEQLPEYLGAGVNQP